MWLKVTFNVDIKCIDNVVRCKHRATSNRDPCNQGATSYQRPMDLHID